jgi:predicted nucleic acid-binding Zn ribbon protein
MIQKRIVTLFYGKGRRKRRKDGCLTLDNAYYRNVVGQLLNAALFNHYNAPMKGDKKNCLVCQTEFIPKNPKGKFCSTKCRMKNMRSKETEVIVTEPPLKSKVKFITTTPESYDGPKAVPLILQDEMGKWPSPIRVDSPIKVMPKGLTLAEQLEWRLENIVKIK